MNQGGEPSIKDLRVTFALDNPQSIQYYTGNLIPELGILYFLREWQDSFYGRGEGVSMEMARDHWEKKRDEGAMEEVNKWIQKEQEILDNGGLNKTKSSEYKKIIEEERLKREKKTPTARGRYELYRDRIREYLIGKPAPPELQSRIWTEDCPSCNGRGCKKCKESGYITMQPCRCCWGSGNSYVKATNTYYYEKYRGCECCKGTGKLRIPNVVFKENPSATPSAIPSAIPSKKIPGVYYIGGKRKYKKKNSTKKRRTIKKKYHQ